jgi:hypothetical protein
LATIDRREASSGSEAPGVAATGRFAACQELARALVARLRRLHRLPLDYGPKKTLYNRFVRWAEKGV